MYNDWKTCETIARTLMGMRIAIIEDYGFAGMAALNLLNQNIIVNPKTVDEHLQKVFPKGVPGDVKTYFSIFLTLHEVGHYFYSPTYDELIDACKRHPNIEEELQAPFPFGMSKQDLFKLYEDVFCISDSAVILKAAKGQEEQVKFEIGNLENEILKNNKKIEELEKFKKEVDLNLLKTYKNSLVTSSQRLMSLKDGLPSIKIAAKLEGVKIEEANEIFINVLPQYSEKVELKKLAGKLGRLHKLGTSLNTNYTPPSNLIEKRRDLINLQKELRILSELSKITFNDFEAISQLPKYLELQEISKTAELLKNIKDIKLPSFSASADYQRYRELKQLSKEVKEIQDSLKVKEELLTKVKNTVEQTSERLKEFKVCPLCQRPLED